MSVSSHCIPDLSTGTCQWIFGCARTKQAVLVDPVLDFNFDSGRFSHENVDKVVAYLKEHGLHLAWVLETHVHADHVSSSQELRKIFPNTKIGIGEHVSKVQETFKPIYNLDFLKTDGSQFDKLFKDGESLQVGDIHVQAIFTPGHTPDSTTYHIHGVGLCVGDTLFYPDKGTARCDFPNGSASLLFESIQKILKFPDETRILLCHDYPGTAREFRCETTVGAEKKENIHLAPNISFVDVRTQRDATLKIPHLLIPSVQLNLNAGSFPPPEKNGTSYIKIPINVFKN